MPPTAKPKKSVSKTEIERRKKQAARSAKPSKTARGSGWRKGADLQPQELTLPSGATCLVAQPGMEALVKAGLIDRIDVLTPLIDVELVQPAKNGGEKVARLPENLTHESLLAIYELADRITVAVVLDPPVLLAPVPKCKVCDWEDVSVATHHPADKHELDLVPRDPDAYYTDGVDGNDKFFILTFALGGPQSVASFLAQSNASVGTVAAEQGVAGDAESATGTDE